MLEDGVIVLICLFVCGHTCAVFSCMICFCMQCFLNTLEHILNHINVFFVCSCFNTDLTLYLKLYSLFLLELVFCLFCWICLQLFLSGITSNRCQEALFSSMCVF